MRTPYGTLFGTDAIQGNLLSINMLTGAGTIVGDMGITLPVLALSIDPTTGVMYAGTGGGMANLYTVDPATGAATLIGNIGWSFDEISDLAFRSDGTLFASVARVGSGGDHLAIIDKNTAAATVIGPFGTCVSHFCTIDGMDGIAFDDSGVLWGCHSAHGLAGDEGLYTIDTATGKATFATAIANPDGTKPSGGVASLKFSRDGTLFGGTAAAIPPATDGGFLITIDLATGHWSYLGAVSATGDSLDALALLCSPISCSECESIISDPDCRRNFGLDMPDGPNNLIPNCVCHDICVKEVRFIGVTVIPPALISLPPISPCRLNGATLPKLAANTHPDVFVICVDETITNNCTHITARADLFIIAQTTTPGTTVPIVTSITVDFPFNAFIPFPDCASGSLNQAQFINAIKDIDGFCTVIQLNATVDPTGSFIYIAGKVIEKLWKYENLQIVGLRPYDLSPNDIADGFASFTVSQELQPIK